MYAIMELESNFTLNQTQNALPRHNSTLAEKIINHFTINFHLDSVSSKKLFSIFPLLILASLVKKHLEKQGLIVHLLLYYKFNFYAFKQRSQTRSPR